MSIKNHESLDMKYQFIQIEKRPINDLENIKRNFLN